MSNKSNKVLLLIQNAKIRFVVQFHYLLNSFSVLKNVILPGFKFDKLAEEELIDNVLKLTKNRGIEKLAHKMAYQFFGGKKQSVAIAQSMINNPLIIMCDEPSSNLDNKNTNIVFDICKELKITYNKTLLVVTHDLHFAENTQRIITMDDSRIVS